MNKELFEKFVALAKEKGFAPNLDEVNIDKAKKIEQEIFTNIDNAINCTINSIRLKQMMKKIAH